ncbi:hypothetical protein ACQKM2_15670 [Streptomyces sp. NPDC004126]|uniref:hypothetical protein n=1 Tax=Streptomyces sp. NPDC004126 TaxID=3390695 RepID=UPI003D053F0D
MPDRPPLENTLDALRAEVGAGGTTRDAWLAFTRFGRRRFETTPTPDSDGLLFQYGTYAFSGRPMFTVDLTQQFDVSDDDGEHAHYAQVHCELRFGPAPDLDALGSFDSWFFHDADEDLEEWFAAMADRLGPLLLDRTPCETDLYEETV